ncbi:tyrosine-type recombinase/integrase [Aureimonas pseudogalii]|uniref:Integrase n=1 Tax=Aureimonas pseudogalii TaxID=1744844 RepID=A0A7W6MMG4_9HYPH|nr:site-specific integrase [Aureimonas pseudogalii]MBB4000825.1 integrase [Aureimonas pseudogalii]
MNDLIDPDGHRLYLTASERAAFLAAAAKADREVRTFCEVLHTTGCRISEALALTMRRVDLDARVLVFETLKKRRAGVFRAVPVPAPLLDTLDLVHGLREARKRPGDPLLWEWSRTTAWRDVKGVMRAAGIEGPQATPKGLRHGYGVAAIGAAVPLNMLSKWMGHAAIETTAIYANALGEEQRSIAERMWR